MQSQQGQLLELNLKVNSKQTIKFTSKLKQATKFHQHTVKGTADCLALIPVAQCPFSVKFQFLLRVWTFKLDLVATPLFQSSMFSLAQSVCETVSECQHLRKLAFSLTNVNVTHFKTLCLRISTLFTSLKIVLPSRTYKTKAKNIYLQKSSLIFSVS